MRILFIAPYVPSRIRVRPFHFIKELAQRHDIHVAALGENKKAGFDELAEVVKQFHIVPHSKLRGMTQSLMALPTPTPLCAAYCWSPAMQAYLRKLTAAEKFDVVHIEHLRAAHFAGVCGQTPIVFDSVDCLTGLFGQMRFSKRNPVSRLLMVEEHFKLKRYEPRVLSSFQKVVITSDSECSELKSLGPSLTIEVVPNGVDTEYFAPMGSEKSPHRIVFSGKMGYYPNAEAATWFATNVFPAVKTRYSDAEFVIVGSDPPSDILRLQENPGITVTGFVDDIRPYLDSSTLAVVPMRVAVGVQNKILEAMAMALPVVTTSISTRPLGAGCPGVVQADGISDMIDEVIKLLDHQKSAQETGKAGRDKVVRDFSWKSSVTKLEQAYEETIKAYQPGR
ncbi:MAG: glycosyltransferase [Armatimonadota bacterium]|jgi:sugar transferase (PEP-CTERM/EpsH1 system associated)